MRKEHQINTEVLLEKMLNGPLSAREKTQLRDYISSTYRDEKLNDTMSMHWDKLGPGETLAESLRLKALKEEILSKIESLKRTERKPNKEIVIDWKTYLVRVAAVLFIPLLISSAFLFYRLNQKADLLADQSVMQQVVASPGSRVQFTLPDQTRVWLNSGSILEFPMNMNQQRQRKVNLSGQGYFEVSHDRTHPFIVRTNEMDIKVLGTSFDISSYTNDATMSSTLEQGSIVLLNFKGNEVACLEPGQKAVLNKKSRELLVEEVDTRLTTSWKDGRLIFRNCPLPEVTRQLERWFNCNIYISKGLTDSDILYTATIQDETLGEVLKMIEISTSVKTKIKNREATIWLER